MMFELKDRVLSRMIPRPFSHGEMETDELLIVTVKLLVLDNVDLEPAKRSSDFFWYMKMPII